MKNLEGSIKDRMGKIKWKIEDLVCRPLDFIFRNPEFSISVPIILTVIGTIGFIGYLGYKEINPEPPIYRDVNNDGVEDKIIGNKVFYGVELNGKKIYLPQEQIEENQR